MKKQKFIAILFAILTILYPFSLYKEVFATESQALYKKASEVQIAPNIQNSLVLVSFAGDGSNFPGGFEEDILKMYNTSPYSVSNYLKQQSVNKVVLNTTLLEGAEGKIINVEHSENYYKPRFKWQYSEYIEINEEGYDNRFFNQDGEPVSPTSTGAKMHIEGSYREQQLIREIAGKIVVSKSYNADLLQDGKCDSFIIITDQTQSSSREDVLWSHKSSVYLFSDAVLENFYVGDLKEECKKMSNVSIAKSVLSNYSLLSSIEITATTIGENNLKVLESERGLYNIGLLAHEMLHVLGLPDYYSYTDSTYESVGEFDVMGTTHVLPQNMLGYLRLKMGWLNYDNVLYINNSGSYSLPLAADTNDKSIAKIILSDYNNTGEYFMAEFRSATLASETNPYDSTLTGDGLIVYRVNPANAYINSSNEKGSIDYGNMYGDDEVFVYRLGMPGKIKKTSSPAFESYCLFGSGADILTWDNGALPSLYNNRSFGNSSKQKQANNLVTNPTSPSETIVFYSDGTNSCIVFSNIVIDKVNRTVNFEVSLPEKEGQIPMLNSDNVFIEEGTDGRMTLKWNSDVKSGKVTVMAVRSTNRIRKMAESGKSGITLADFKNKKFGHYETLFYQTIPAAEKQILLPELGMEALVFVAIESDAGKSAVRYVGALENLNPSFSDLFKVIIDPIYYMGLVIIVIVFIIIWFLISNIQKKESSKRVYKK